MERFQIRPRPIPGESLSTFLARVSLRNKSKLFSVLRYLDKGKTGVFQRSYTYRLDLIPENVIDISRLKHLCAISEDDIRNMSLHSLHVKMYDVPSLDTGTMNLIARQFEKRRRYFCPVCLKKNGVFKLLWQIEGIEICDVHRVQLECTCRSCGAEQPFISDQLPQIKCFKCESTLLSNGTVASNTSLLESQLRTYMDWKYILYSNQSLVPRVERYSNEKSCILSVLALQKQLGIQVLSSRHEQALLGYIKEARNKNWRLSIARFLSALRSFHISIEEWSTIQVLPWAVEEMLAPKRKYKRKDVGPCLAPWCPSYGSTQAMVPLEYGNRKKNKSSHSVCTDCFMRYAYQDDSNKWYEVNGDIELIWERVYPLAQLNLFPSTIKKRLKMDYEKILQILAYLSYRRVGDTKVRKFFSCSEIPINVVQCFRQITTESSNMRKMVKKARELFGWSAQEFFYYYVSDEVQRYMVFESPRLYGVTKSAQEKWRKLVADELRVMKRSDRQISLTEISKRLGCSEHVLKSHGLHKMVADVAYEQKRGLLAVLGG